MKKTHLLFLLFLSPLWASAQSVDILWQGETYVPPFYPGLPAWSTQSALTLVAMPQGLGNAANLNYLWRKNGTALGTISGVGKSSMVIVDSVLSKPLQIGVEILGADDEIIAEKSILVEPIAPSVSVYENNPLYGFMFHRGVTDAFAMDGTEVTFSAFPIFSNTSSRLSPNVSYQWKSGGEVMTDKPSVTFRAPEERGESLISVESSNSYLVLPPITKDFLVKFGTNE